MAVAVAVALGGLVAGVATVYLGSASHTLGAGVRRAALAPADPAGSSPGPARPAPGRSGAENYVVLGADSRDPRNPSVGSDTLMVLHLAADRRSAYLVSVPPDLYVPVPGSRRDRISAAASLGGPPLVVATLEQLLRTRMDHVAVVDFDGLVDLTDTVGGVTVANRYATSSGDHHFPVGTITLNGDQARAFVRDRYGLPHGELDRARRQRQVIRAIFERGLSRDTLADRGALQEFAAAAGRYITVDDQLSDDEIGRTATTLRLRADDVRLLSLPTAGLGTANGASVDLVDQTQLDALARALRDDTMAEYVARHPRG